MKKWINRALGIFFVAGLILGGCGASGNQGNTSQTGAESVEASAAEAAEAETAETAEAEAAGTVLEGDDSMQEQENQGEVLPDGEYVPDAFSFSGGTGRVVISCSRVTLQGGEAMAELSFDSPYYTYVKVDGVQYDTTITEDCAEVEIPISLNENNRILALTTRMSTPHEIEYEIFVYIAASGGGSEGLISGCGDALDEEAPLIAGLIFESETDTEGAQLFKLYNYEGGIRLLEIDRLTGTDGESEADEETGSAAKEGALAETDEAAALYMQPVVRYLLVPENVSIPAGLDSALIIVPIPAQQIFAGDEAVATKLSDAGGAEIGMTDCGSFDAPNYRNLVLGKCSLALMPETLTDDPVLYESLCSSFEELGIPLILDRSEGEATEEAARAWQLVYQALLGLK